MCNREKEREWPHFILHCEKNETLTQIFLPKLQNNKACNTTHTDTPKLRYSYTVAVGKVTTGQKRRPLVSKSQLSVKWQDNPIVNTLQQHLQKNNFGWGQMSKWQFFERKIAVLVKNFVKKIGQQPVLHIQYQCCKRLGYLSYFYL